MILYAADLGMNFYVELKNRIEDTQSTICWLGVFFCYEELICVYLRQVVFQNILKYYLTWFGGGGII